MVRTKKSSSSKSTSGKAPRPPIRARFNLLSTTTKPLHPVGPAGTFLLECILKRSNPASSSSSSTSSALSLSTLPQVLLVSLFPYLNVTSACALVSASKSFNDVWWDDIQALRFAVAQVPMEWTLRARQLFEEVGPRFVLSGNIEE